MGRHEVIRHPIARRIEENSFAITGWWLVTLAVGFVAQFFVGRGILFGRGIGWALVFLPAVPSVVIWFFVRLFPLYRVTRCPYCGFTEIQRLRARKKPA